MTRAPEQDPVCPLCGRESDTLWFVRFPQDSLMQMCPGDVAQLRLQGHTVELGPAEEAA
jgi:hypothetical protein